MAKGATAKGKKPIEKIVRGDLVWTKNLRTGRSELRPVVGLFHKNARSLMTITLTDGTTVKVTPEHPFYVPGTGWVMTRDLLPGDPLQRRDGARTAIKTITTSDANTTVYNFEVAANHDYYVTGAQLLVRNCPPINGHLAEACIPRRGSHSTWTVTRTSAPTCTSRFRKCGSNLWEAGPGMSVQLTGPPV